MKPKRIIRLTKRTLKVENLSMLDRFDLIRKEMDEGKYTLKAPTILIDEFDPCEMCGS